MHTGCLFIFTYVSMCLTLLRIWFKKTFTKSCVTAMIMLCEQTNVNALAAACSALLVINQMAYGPTGMSVFVGVSLTYPCN